MESVIKFINKANWKGIIALIVQNERAGQKRVADEIIDNAAELPVEEQQTLLTVAKAMQYTRSCILHNEHKAQER